MKTAINLLILTAVWLAVVGFFAWPTIREIRSRRIDLTRFKIVEGVVTASEVKRSVPVGRRKIPDYKPHIEYAYEAGGVRHTGVVPSVGSSSPFESERLVANHPVGRRIDVACDAGDPSKSSIKPELVTRENLFSIVFFHPFVLVGLIFLVAAVRAPFGGAGFREFARGPLRTPCAIPTWGMFERDKAKFTIRNNRHPVGALFFWWFLSSIAMIFVIDSWFIHSRPEKVLPWALTLPPAIGFLFVIYFAVRPVTTLVFDTGRKTVAKAQGTKKEFEVPFAEIEAIRLDVHKLGTGDDPVRSPVLQIKTAKEEPVVLRQFPMANRNKEAWTAARKVGQRIAEMIGRPFQDLGDLV